MRLKSIGLALLLSMAPPAIAGDIADWGKSASRLCIEDQGTCEYLTHFSGLSDFCKTHRQGIITEAQFLKAVDYLNSLTGTQAPPFKQAFKDFKTACWYYE
tara:strand:+ start:463 stop:765 length:303 start_codon:yes stop_codon:yes gene_type:complete